MRLALSWHPRIEDVLIVAHGPADDEENERWLTTTQERSKAIAACAPFRRVEVHTLREDWPKKRVEAQLDVRAFVERAKDEGGGVIAIPFRVQGFGPYADVLEKLDYTSDGQGLLPHPNVTHWIAQQAALLQHGPFHVTID